MSDDFFKQLDGKLGALKTAQAAEAEQKDSARSFATKTLEELRPLAEKYARQLGERGIRAKVTGNNIALIFEMHWSNGDEHGLSLEAESKTGRLKIVRHSTDHTNHKHFRSESGITYDASSWNTAHFEAALQSVINDYVLLADKHGGVS